MSEDESAGETKRGFWRRLTGGLKRTSSALSTAISDLVTKRKLDAETIIDIRDVLVRADLGLETAERISDVLEKGGHAKAISAAGDTFRAAAIEQLKTWGEHTGAEVIARETGADAAGLVFDAVRAAKERGVDVLLVDTAGRLQNRTELMEELHKVVRVMKKVDASA